LAVSSAVKFTATVPAGWGKPFEGVELLLPPQAASAIEIVSAAEECVIGMITPWSCVRAETDRGAVLPNGVLRSDRDCSVQPPLR
jgi:hypothetical protein